MTSTQTPEPNPVAAFTIADTYAMRSPGDHNCIWTFDVIARTAQFVTLRQHDREGTVRRCKVSVVDGVEYVSPFGRYSLSPVLTAESEI